MSSNTKSYLLLSNVANFVGWVLAVVSLISSNKNGDIIKFLDWGRARLRKNGYTHVYYVGVAGLEYQATTTTTSEVERVLYDSDFCDITLCRTCKHYMPIVIGFLVAFLVVSLPSFYTNYVRYNGTGNTSTNKWIGIGSSFASIILGLISLIVFSDTCFVKVRHYLSDYVNNHYEYTYGIAFALLCVSVTFKFIDIVGNHFALDDEAAKSAPAYGEVKTVATPDTKEVELAQA